MRAMRRRIPISWLLVAFAFGLLPVGCQSGGVGDPCTPEDEYQTTFSGFSEEEVNIESRSFQCTTRVCLVNHFRGRVSCPYGQTPDVVSSNTDPENQHCHIPGRSDKANRITVPVQPQISGSVKQGGRRASDTVYCSCRCRGPDPNARYCSCPSGYHCPSNYLVPDLGLGSGQLAGAYCVRDGTDYNPTAPKGPDCVYGTTPGNTGYCGHPSGTSDTKGVNP